MKQDITSQLAERSKLDCVGVAKRLSIQLGDYARLSKDDIIGRIIANRGEDVIVAALSHYNGKAQQAPDLSGGAQQAPQKPEDMTGDASLIQLRNAVADLLNGTIGGDDAEAFMASHGLDDGGISGDSFNGLKGADLDGVALAATETSPLPHTAERHAEAVAEIVQLVKQRQQKRQRPEQQQQSEPAPQQPEKQAQQPAQKPEPNESELVKALRAAVGTPALDADAVKAIADEAIKTAIAAALKDVQPGEVIRTIVVKDGVKVNGAEFDHVRDELQDVVDLASQGMNIMLVGPAGSGKSFFAEQVATALGRPFTSNSCSAGMSESALSGWLLPVGESGKFHFVSASFVHTYENGGVHLIDEIDAADPNTLIFVNQALANGKFYIPQRHENPLVLRHKDFVCIAAANTYGNGGDRLYVGREQLDAATLDRFWTVAFGYDAKMEEKFCSAKVLKWGREVRAKIDSLKLRRVVSSRKLIQASVMEKAGWPLAKIQKSFFEPWSTDERAKVGYAA